MIYEYPVKFNGVYYKAGEDVPSGASKPVVNEPKQETVVETVIEEPKPKTTTKAKAKK